MNVLQIYAEPRCKNLMAPGPVERPEPPDELYDAPSAEYAPEDLFGLNIPLSGIDSDPLFSGNLWASG